MTIDKFIMITEIKTQLAVMSLRYRIYRSAYQHGNMPMQAFLQLEEQYIEETKFLRFQVNARKLLDQYAYS